MRSVKSRLVGLSEHACFAVTLCCLSCLRDVAPVPWAYAACFLQSYSFGDVQGSVPRVQGRSMHHAGALPVCCEVRFGIALGCFSRADGHAQSVHCVAAKAADGAVFTGRRTCDLRCWKM